MTPKEARPLQPRRLAQILCLLAPLLILSIAGSEEKMARIPAGMFLRGSEAGDPDESPVRAIYLGAFLIDRYEVTHRKYQRFILSTGHPPPGSTHAQGRPYAWRDHEFPPGMEGHPVVLVSWEDAAAYCRWAEKRLPTEAEWERAAKGNGAGPYPWGAAWASGRANSAERWAGRPIQDVRDLRRFFRSGYQLGFSGTGPRTEPVGSYPLGATPEGVFDLAGNVYEWVSDWYRSDYYAHSPERDPQGPPEGLYRVVRGGAWLSPQRDLRASFRAASPPTSRDIFTGFRCAKSGEGQ